MNSQEWRSSSSQPSIDPLALYHLPLVIFQEQSLAAKWTHKKMSRKGVRVKEVLTYSEPNTKLQTVK